MRYMVEASTRYVVDGADCPARLLQWFTDSGDIDLDCFPISYDHLTVVGTVTNDIAIVELEPGTYEAWRTANVVPLGAQEMPQPISRLQRFARCFAAATRPLAFRETPWGRAWGQRS